MEARAIRKKTKPEDAKKKEEELFLEDPGKTKQ